MRFTKPALTLDQQVEHLQARGMLGDTALMKRRLESVNYYRLSAYWHTFRESGGERFLPGTNFDVVWARYAFDRELRLLVMDAVERFEVAVRTRIAYELALVGGPFGYMDGLHAVWANDAQRKVEFTERVEKALQSNRREPFIEHFHKQYGDMHDHPPIWVAVEVLMFGDLVSCFKGSNRGTRRAVADYFGVADVVLDSWLICMNLVRNLCAHHGRLWNRELGVKPKLPRDNAWTQPVRVTPDRIFGVLTILAHVMHRIAPGSRWTTRVRSAIEGETAIDLRQMGLPPDWTLCDVWVRAWRQAEVEDSQP